MLNPISTPPHSRSLVFATSINGLSGSSLRPVSVNSFLFAFLVVVVELLEWLDTHNGHSHTRNLSQTKPPPLSLSQGNEDSKLPSTTSAIGGDASSVRATGGEAGTASSLASAKDWKG